jgi:hypothetical protein
VSHDHRITLTKTTTSVEIVLETVGISSAIISGYIYGLMSPTFILLSLVLIQFNTIDLRPNQVSIKSSLVHEGGVHFRYSASHNVCPARIWILRARS